jgi:hypothetical protein|tara:strand:+ start:27 stop:770 length:744 start_codon:yes stop_codon:yes gene_type:complete
MAQPTTRPQFKEWCLRKLGKPVIEINVDADQAEDRIDEALSYYWDYHFDGTEKTYLKHEITQADITNQYLTVPENIIGVVNLFPVGSSITAGSGMFNVQYQFVLNNIHEMVSYNLTNYYMSMQNLQFMEELLVGQQPIRYNRHINRLFIDMDWAKMAVGNFVVAECYKIVDPATYADVYKDRWLQNYAAAKIKFQWGSNLTKFNGMTLPGNIQFSGEQILNDARDEIRQLEDEMMSSYSLPVVDMIG